MTMRMGGNVCVYSRLYRNLIPYVRYVQYHVQSYVSYGGHHTVLYDYRTVRTVRYGTVQYRWFEFEI